MHLSIKLALASSIGLALAGCTTAGSQKHYHVSHSKQMQVCHQIKQELGHLNNRLIPTQGGDMPTTRSQLVEEYEKYDCQSIEDEI